jgi:glycosyltransferase involved in cell wall biosynthesis
MVLPDGTLDTGFSGASSRYAQNYQALTDLGAEVHVLRICDAAKMAASHDYEASMNGVTKQNFHPASWLDVTYSPPSRTSGRFHILRESLTDPIRFNYPAGPAINRAIQDSINTLNPDLLWLERAVTVSAAGQHPLPAIYSHHDITYRVQALRQAGGGWREKYLLWVQRRAEQAVGRQAAHIVTGSETDAQRLRDWGCPHVMAIPTAYPRRPEPPGQARAERDRLRIIHLGSLETTANRLGLTGYLQQAHQEATAQCAAAAAPLALWVIGDNRQVHPRLAALLAQPNVHQTGFVPDLETVLRPFDVAILPYEHDTGYRTKLPLLLSYAQVVVTTKAAVAGTQPAGLAGACVMVDRVTDFPAVLSRLATRPEERERLGRAAHRFFMRHFTHAAVQPQYAHLWQQVRVAQP